MPSLHLDHFGGMTPAIDDRSMRKFAATRAVNILAVDGSLRPIRQPKLMREADATVTNIDLVKPHGGVCHGLKAWTEPTQPVTALRQDVLDATCC